ncbi:MAG: helix-turn-helix domain-containing protein [Dehalococcoidales bacterium]
MDNNERQVYRLPEYQTEAYRPLDLVKVLHCSKNLVYSMIASGQIKSIRCGNSRKSIIIPRKSLDEFLATAGQNQPPAAPTGTAPN